MRSIKIYALLALVLVMCLSGCKKSAESPPVPAELPPAGLAGTGEQARAVQLEHPSKADQKLLTDSQKNRTIVTGKVVEAIYKESFAYVRLDVSGEDSVWVAIVNEQPTVGQIIKVQEQAILKDFHSKSLDRTFATIIFGSIVD